MQQQSIKQHHASWLLRAPRLLGVVGALSSTSKTMRSEPYMSPCTPQQVSGLPPIDTSKKSNEKSDGALLICSLLGVGVGIGIVSTIGFKRLMTRWNARKQKIFFNTVSHMQLPKSALNDIKAQRQALTGLLARLNKLTNAQAKKSTKELLARFSNLAILSREEKRLLCLEVVPNLTEAEINYALSLPCSSFRNLLICHLSQESQTAITAWLLEECLQLSTEQIWQQRTAVEDEANALRQQVIALLRSSEADPMVIALVSHLAPSLDLKKAMQSACASMSPAARAKFLRLSLMLWPDPIVATQAMEGVLEPTPKFSSSEIALSDERSLWLILMSCYDTPQIFELFLIQKNIFSCCEQSNFCSPIQSAIETKNLAALSVLVKHKVEMLERESLSGEQSKSVPVDRLRIPAKSFPDPFILAHDKHA